MSHHKTPTPQQETIDTRRRKLLAVLGLGGAAAYVAPSFFTLGQAHAWGEPRITIEIPGDRRGYRHDRSYRHDHWHDKRHHKSHGRGHYRRPSYSRPSYSRPSYSRPSYSRPSRW